MQIVVCKQGHYYDSSKFKECPTCNRGAPQQTVSPPTGGTENQSARMVQPQFTEWTKATQASDPNRTQQEYKERSVNSYITGWLVCVEGAECGRDYRLRAGFNRVGRSHKMDVCIFEDDGISRDTHCSIVYDNRKNCFALVPGVGSMTWKGDELIEKPVELLSGERFRIGDTVLEFIAFCRDNVKW